MPASPKIDDVCRLVWRVGVLRKAAPEQKSESNGHIGVAGKIEIEMQRSIDHRPKPAVSELGDPPWATVSNTRSARGAMPSANSTFFARPNTKQADPERKCWCSYS